MKEAADLSNRILIEIPKRWPAARALRRNVGGAVGMNTVKAAIAMISRGQVQDAIKMLRRPTRFGIEGEPDLEGLITIHGLAVFFGVEIKIGRDTTSDAQERFRAQVVRMGGIYVVARELEQGLRDLGHQIELKRGNGWEVGK